MSLRDQLVELILGSGVELDGELDDETSLVQSGLLDSMALFELMTFIAERVDPTIDLTAFDVRQEWDTVTSVLAFIDRHRPERDLYNPESPSIDDR